MLGTKSAPTCNNNDMQQQRHAQQRHAHKSNNDMLFQAQRYVEILQGLASQRHAYHNNDMLTKTSRT